MRQHRGVTESTLRVYDGSLAELQATVGADPAAYTAKSVRRFVLERARRHGVSYAKLTASAVRTFLQFLAATGRCRAGLAHAIPAFASWNNTSMPRFLTPEDLERVVASCTGRLDWAARQGNTLAASPPWVARRRRCEINAQRYRLVQWNVSCQRQRQATRSPSHVTGGGRRDQRLPGARTTIVSNTRGIYSGFSASLIHWCLRQSLRLSGARCAGPGSRHQSTVLMFSGTPRPRPCFATARPWPASARSFAIVLPDNSPLR